MESFYIQSSYQVGFRRRFYIEMYVPSTHVGYTFFYCLFISYSFS